MQQLQGLTLVTPVCGVDDAVSAVDCSRVSGLLGHLPQHIWQQTLLCC
jgi:hypothetical protein